MERRGDSLPFALQDCFVLPECRLLYLDSFLIAPLQRICKYPLLFKVRTSLPPLRCWPVNQPHVTHKTNGQQELDKHTDEAHPDHQAVQEASRAMTSLLMLINERTRQAENIDKMILVNSKLEFKEGEVPPFCAQYYGGAPCSPNSPLRA
jgi:hypothetical protein